MKKKRGVDARRLQLLLKLQRLLRAPSDPERMLKSVAGLLAVEIGQYCLVDVIDRRGVVRRLDVEHPDPSRRPVLRIACEDADVDGSARLRRLFTSGESELIARVTDGARARSLSDILVMPGELARSYMAAVVTASGSPFAVLTLVSTVGNRRYDDDELDFLRCIAEWTGLGVENALHRELQPRTSVLPPTLDEEAPASRRTSTRRR